MTISQHIYKQSKTCRCRMDADEPNENCPIHGVADGRCDCGRFVARPKPYVYDIGESNARQNEYWKRVGGHPDAGHMDYD